MCPKSKLSAPKPKMTPYEPPHLYLVLCNMLSSQPSLQSSLLCFFQALIEPAAPNKKNKTNYFFTHSLSVKCTLAQHDHHPILQVWTACSKTLLPTAAQSRKVVLCVREGLQGHHTLQLLQMDRCCKPYHSSQITLHLRSIHFNRVHSCECRPW